MYSQAILRYQILIAWFSSTKENAHKSEPLENIIVSSYLRVLNKQKNIKSMFYFRREFKILIDIYWDFLSVLLIKLRVKNKLYLVLS